MRTFAGISPGGLQANEEEVKQRGGGAGLAVGNCLHSLNGRRFLQKRPAPHKQNSGGKQAASVARVQNSLRVCTCAKPSWSPAEARTPWSSHLRVHRPSSSATGCCLPHAAYEEDPDVKTTRKAEKCLQINHHWSLSLGGWTSLWETDSKTDIVCLIPLPKDHDFFL